MNRTAFLAAVHELAGQLGAALWSIVEREGAAARATALEVATARLRAQISGSDEVPSAPARKRAPRRCSSCKEPGHDARKCPSASSGTPLTPSSVIDDAERDEEESDDVEDRRATPSPPPTRIDRFARIESQARNRRAKGA